MDFDGFLVLMCVSVPSSSMSSFDHLSIVMASFKRRVVSKLVIKVTTLEHEHCFKTVTLRMLSILWKIQLTLYS